MKLIVQDKRLIFDFSDVTEDELDKVEGFLEHVEDVTTNGGTLNIPAQSFEIEVEKDEPVADWSAVSPPATDEGFALDGQI